MCGGLCPSVFILPTSTHITFKVLNLSTTSTTFVRRQSVSVSHYSYLCDSLNEILKDMQWRQCDAGGGCDSRLISTPLSLSIWNGYTNFLMFLMAWLMNWSFQSHWSLKSLFNHLCSHLLTASHHSQSDKWTTAKCRSKWNDSYYFSCFSKSYYCLGQWK